MRAQGRLVTLDVIRGVAVMGIFSVNIVGMAMIDAAYMLAMALGYAALLILWARRPGWLRDRVAATGRAAFSNYLFSSIAGALIFFGGGLALYGSLDRFHVWLIVPIVWLAMLAWSEPWLDRFAYGPFEWLWRSLARWKIQPFRKRLPPTSLAAEA